MGSGGPAQGWGFCLAGLLLKSQMVEMWRNLGEVTPFPGFLLPTPLIASLQHPQPSHPQSARQQRAAAGAASSRCCAWLCPHPVGTQALGSKRGHRASQGDPASQGWRPAWCAAWPFAGSQGTSRAAACSDPAPAWPTGARLQASPREQAHHSLAAELKKGLFRSFPTGLVISLLLLRGKIPQGRRLVANQAAEAMAVKSEVSSPRYLLLLAGLAPPIPTSSAPGAHPNLTGWAGSNAPGHCKAALVGPRIREEHPSPTGVRVAAPQQGQPRLPTPLPCPQQGCELSSSHYIPAWSFPIHGHLLEQPARSRWASTLPKSCCFSSSNQVEDASAPLLLTTSALGGPSSNKLVSPQGQAPTTPGGEPGCR